MLASAVSKKMPRATAGPTGGAVHPVLRYAHKSTRIPSAYAPGALTVTDGQQIAGTVVHSNGSYFSFDADGGLLGTFTTETVKSSPFADDGGAS
jgi:hypothetical protein